MSAEIIQVKWLDRQPYSVSWQAMQHFTNERTAETLDEIWMLEHEPVFTQGQNGKTEHILAPNACASKKIPIIQSDRGGQITYHGPGQLMIYTLIDLKRKKFSIHEMVRRLENSLIDFLSFHRIKSNSKKEAPGVYIENKKIGSIGLRVRRGCTYHGVAFNVGMDLSPFSLINPCGHRGLAMTQLKEFMDTAHPFTIGKELIYFLMQHLGYHSFNFENTLL